MLGRQRFRQSEVTSKQQVITKGEANKRFQLSANSRTPPPSPRASSAPPSPLRVPAPLKGKFRLHHHWLPGWWQLLCLSQIGFWTAPCGVFRLQLSHVIGGNLAKSWSPRRPFLYQDGVTGSHATYAPCRNYSDGEAQEGTV